MCRDYNKHVLAKYSDKRLSEKAKSWQARTGRMCKICDPEATKLFPSYRSLIRHLEMEHQKQLCELCMEVSYT